MTDRSLPHVVHIIDELPPDGAERLIVDVLQNRSDKFRFSVLCLVAGGPMEADLAAINVPVIILGRKRGLDIGTIPALVKWFKQNDVSVVHTHLYAADSYGRLAAWLARVPGRFSTRHNVGSWSGFTRKAIAWMLGLLSTRVIACGEEVGRSLVKREHLPKNRVIVVANGINLRRFEQTDRREFRSELKIDADCVVMGVIGRLHPQKGHTDLLEALEALRKLHGNFLCVFVGSGELKTSLETEIERRGLGQHVRLMGQRNDIPNILAGLDVFVMSSRWEGLPMALLESMALGNAIVTTAVGAIPDVIKNGTNGLLVPPENPTELYRALTAIMAQPELRHSLGTAARRTVVDCFNAKSTAARYEELYADAIRPSR